MRRLLALACVAGSLSCGSPPPPPPPEAAPRDYPRAMGPRLRVSVANFPDEEPNLPDLQQLGFKEIGPLLEEQLVTELVRTGRVTVLERKQLKKVAGEIDLGYGEMSEYFAKSEKVEKGKFLMAQAMFTGAVTIFEPDAEGFQGGVSVQGIGGSLGMKTARVGIDVRLVDVKTAKVIEATHAEGTASRMEGEAGISYLGIKIGGGGYYKTPLGRATRAALNKAVDFILAKVGDVPWEARIVSVEPPAKVVVKGGEDINLQPGDTFDVLVRAKELFDADSGTSLGFVEQPWGTVQIDEVQPEVSLGHMLEGKRVPPLNAVIRVHGAKLGSGSGLVATTGDVPSGATASAPATARVGTPTPMGVPAGTRQLEVPTYFDVAPIPEAARSTPAKAKDADKNGIPKSLYASDGRPAALPGADRLVLAKPVEFDFGAATLAASAMNLLDQITYLLVAQPQLGTIRVEGHTDNVGDGNRNLRLSEARARAVMNYLVARGVPEERLSAQGFGAQKPLVDNGTEAGRAKNRRVEFVFVR